MDIDELAAAFPDGTGFVNTAALGLPPHVAVTAIEQHLGEWRSGRSDPADFDDDVPRSRHAYARLVGADPSIVAGATAVSTAAGLVASSLPDGAHVLCAEEDFTSVLFPFMADPRLDVRTVPLARLLDSVTPAIDLVAVSAVQSADGRTLDLDALADAAGDAAARTFLDVTQAAGWLPFDAHRFDVTACGAYKWLCCPRGTGFMTAAPAAWDWLVPRYASWFAGDDPWASIYGPPLRLARDARRFDVSPAWIAWRGAAPTLELLADAGVDVVGRHDLALANALRERLDLPPAPSPIVSLDVPGGVEALASAGIRCSGRAGRVRVSFHLYNSVDDVDRIADALDRTRA